MGRPDPKAGGGSPALPLDARRRRALVTGSLAYDFIVDYPGPFEPKLAFREGVRHTATFPVDVLRRTMGGCGGNVAYTIAALGGDPILASVVGEDGDAYLAHLRARGVKTRDVRKFADMLTAQAYIANDPQENQIIFFFGGATARAHELELAPYAAKAALAIVSPNGKRAMLAHAKELRALGIPFFLDLGQGLGLFSGAELRRMLKQATWAIFNRMEFEDFCRASGMDGSQVEGSVDALVVTDSLNGSVIRAAGEVHRIDAEVRGKTLDPTGCGDAYRGALIHAMLAGRSWPDAGRFASRVAGIKALTAGGQTFSVPKKALAGL